MKNKKPFLIAEISANHCGSFKLAKKLIKCAKDNGANAVKLQTYSPSTMTINSNKKYFRIKSGLGKGVTIWDLYEKAQTPLKWHKSLFDYAKKIGIKIFSTPYDESAVDFLEKLNCPFYKVASFEMTDIPLIKKIASTKKPMIISTGMASYEEIMESVTAARDSGCNELAILKCTTTYPASPVNTNLSTIPDMKEKFNCEVGLSDHTMGIGVSIAAVSFGASIIEKHFTINRADGGVDSSFSIEPNELKELVKESKRAWEAIGKISYGPTKAEMLNILERRSIYIVQDMKAGQIITKKNVKRIRPGHGLKPKFYEQIIGKKLIKDCTEGTPMSWDLISS